MTLKASVPTSLPPADKDSVLAVLERTCKTFPDRSAFTNQGVSLTYAELDRLSSDLAAYFQHRTPLQPGDRIALMLPNLLQFPIALFAALKAGLIVVPTNPFYSERELRHQLSDSGARAIVYLDMLGDRVEAVIGETQLEILIESSVGDMHTTGRRVLMNAVAKYLKKKIPTFELPQAIPFLDAVEQGYECVIDRLDPEPDDVALLQYTMGTTGVAKGAMLSHANLVANMRQVRTVLDERDEQGLPLFEEGRQLVIAPLPLYHIYAFTAHCLCMMAVGNHSVLITDPRDTDQLIKVLNRYRFNGIVGLNTLFQNLLEHPGFNKVDFRDLRLTLSGGAALTRTVAERWARVTGCEVLEAYGLTEASPAVAMNPLGRIKRGTVGRAVPDTEVRIQDEEGDALAPGEVGELCVRGPQVFQGYWHAPQATADSFTPDGWLKTGDLAWRDEDGYIKIVDRKQDLILVSGFNVYPNEIENVLLNHPGVAACAAVGVPDSHSGEIVKAFVVRRDPDATEAELDAWCRSNLAGYKVPKIIEFCDALPLTPVGKILRRELRGQ
ncbi:AMP-binding protein [Saccharospirillum salsuginis]|uniref:Long-chain-fatty-acid--CoA ligase n=1 Tax=Saccharospirillum salsuginis TaxID=418750 RepID=A0A918NJM5_9GAMM|nr:AMP-binding protein [Saccharospirillum salsuginis]GGX75592.1 long-chain-fatty-acid--CoA ligase [Saccharospirillum salsuginis]